MGEPGGGAEHLVQRCTAVLARLWLPVRAAVGGLAHALRQPRVMAPRRGVQRPADRGVALAELWRGAGRVVEQLQPYQCRRGVQEGGQRVKHGRGAEDASQRESLEAAHQACVLPQQRDGVFAQFDILELQARQPCCELQRCCKGFGILRVIDAGVVPPLRCREFEAS